MPQCPHLTDALAAAMAGLAPARPPGADGAGSVDPAVPDVARRPGLPLLRRVVPGLRWRSTVGCPTAGWEAAEAQEPWDPSARRRFGGR